MSILRQNDRVLKKKSHLQDLRIQGNIKTRGCTEQKNKCATKKQLKTESMPGLN